MEASNIVCESYIRHTFCFTWTINQKTNEISKVFYAIHLIQLHLDEEFSRKLNRIELNFIVVHFILCCVFYCIWMSQWNWTWHTENCVIEIACNVARFVFISTRILHFPRFNSISCLCVCVWIGFCFSCSPLCFNSNHPIVNDNLSPCMNPAHKTID